MLAIDTAFAGPLQRVIVEVVRCALAYMIVATLFAAEDWCSIASCSPAGPLRRSYAAYLAYSVQRQSVDGEMLADSSRIPQVGPMVGGTARAPTSMGRGNFARNSMLGFLVFHCSYG